MTKKSPVTSKLEWIHVNDEEPPKDTPILAWVYNSVASVWWGIDPNDQWLLDKFEDDEGTIQEQDADAYYDKKASLEQWLCGDGDDYSTGSYYSPARFEWWCLYNEPPSDKEYMKNATTS